jgi:hypothetical protein
MTEQDLRPPSVASSSTQLDERSTTQKDAHQHLEKDPATTEAQREIDPAVDKGVTRKCDLHIIPWLFLIWLLAFIDRSNIGNAKIDGLVDDLNLGGTKFNTALVVFYVPYILVDVPSNWIVKHFKAGRYLPALLTGWGLVR